ncbi:MAG TPA: hypothetical protein VGG48_05220 [Rhizomicrobium sp.]|jgi:dienelactone hydrolase
MPDIKTRFAAIRRALTPSPAAWRGATVALAVLWAVLFAWFAAVAVFIDFSLEKLAGLIGFFAVLGLVTAALLFLHWLADRLPTGYRRALYLVLPPLLLFMVLTWSRGVVIGLPLLVLGVSLLFGAIAVWRSGAARTGTMVFGALGAVALALCLYGMLAPPPALNRALADYHLKGNTLALPDPGKPGPYKVTIFTYGSGQDPHRSEYARGVRFVTQSVDGAKLDTQWTGFGGWLRTRYWGFDAHHMPRNGRVWMPQGAGPFPLVLIVHGNHEMEKFSDPGYAYLGKLLASQGFIVVSVDENFLNFSLAEYADPFHLRMGDENKARAWLLLEHLSLWRAWAADAANPLHGKVDMDRIALIGHSRGGEAVSTANAFNMLGAFPDDATVKFDFRFHIRAIAAIAPVDGQYQPRNRPTPMRDQNYFVIQGNMDGDLTSFMGSAQYERATISPGSDAFKASLYVRGANHGQFNTDWGRNDFALPYKFLLDERTIMPGDAQRRIASVYLSAFLQDTLQGRHAYRPLFEDARNGAAWLPDDYLVNNYADGKTQWLATYEEDLDPATGTRSGTTISGPGLTVWREDYPDLKFSPLDTHLALLAWDDRIHKTPAQYVIDFGDAPPVTTVTTSLVFSASQVDMDTLPAGFKTKGPRRNSPDAALSWSIVLVDRAGQEAHVPLANDQELYPQLQGETHRAGAIDFYPLSELVLRRFRFPLVFFAIVNPKLDLANLKQVRFVFDRTSRGAIALDDVGLAR